jgi:hypothetical protein
MNKKGTGEKDAMDFLTVKQTITAQRLATCLLRCNTLVAVEF